MNYLKQQFTENLRKAAIEEVYEGEEFFMANLADLLSPEAIEDGVHIDFGANETRFRQALEILNFDAHVQSGRLDVTGSTVRLGAGITSVINGARVEGAIRELGIMDTLSYLQAEVWDIDKQSDIYKFVTTRIHPQVTSDILLGNLTQPDERGGRYLQPGAPLIVASSTHRYSPEYINEFDEITDDLPYIFDKLKDSGGSSPRKFQQLMEIAATEGHVLHMPEARFNLAISGQPRIQGGILLAHAVPTIKKYYVLSNDRLVPHVDQDLIDE